MPTHLGTVILETERLLLRRVEIADADAMFRNWASDSDVTKYLTWPPHSSVDVTKAVLADWVSHYPEPDFYQWAIVLKGESSEPIGNISKVGGDDRVGRVEIGYCIGKAWWHKGIMSEALKAVMDFFFDRVGMNRVEAQHDVNNPNSGAVMRKCGMVYEGTLRQYGFNNQGICDICTYAQLAQDRD